ncbi:MAG: DoxX family protein [Dehalococcoidia bacterium]
MVNTTMSRPAEAAFPTARAHEMPLTRLWRAFSPERLGEGIMPPATLLLRLVMGWIFVWSGFDKLLGDFSSAGFLANATKGPLTGWFQGLAQNQAALDVIDPLVVWGQILIGLALIFGVGTRFTLFWASAMMFMFYIAQFPPANNPFMDEHLVYILLFVLLGALGAGRILGLDALLERLPWVRRLPLLNLLLG